MLNLLALEGSFLIVYIHILLDVSFSALVE